MTPSNARRDIVGADGATGTSESGSSAGSSGGSGTVCSRSVRSTCDSEPRVRSDWRSFGSFTTVCSTNAPKNTHAP